MVTACVFMKHSVCYDYLRVLLWFICKSVLIISVTPWKSFQIAVFFTHIGVTQSMLETVVPRAPNSAVMLVGGKRKGQVKKHLISNLPHNIYFLQNISHIMQNK